MIFGQVHLFQTVVDFDLVDAGGAVYHPNYLILCDHARTAAMDASAYSFLEFWKDGYALALIENHSRYFRPALLRQKLAITTTTMEATRSTLRIRQEIAPAAALALPPDTPASTYLAQSPIPPDSRDVIHRLDLTLACVTLSPFRPTRLPERLVQALALPRESRAREDSKY